MHTKQNLLLCETSTPAGNWVSSSFTMSSANTLDGVMLSSTRFCLFVKNSVIADVSSVFFIPGVRTGVVAGVDWFAVTNVSLFDVDTTGVCVSVSASPCVSESTPAGVTVESYNKPGMITYALQTSK